MPRKYKKTNYKRKGKGRMPLSSSQAKAVQRIATKSIIRKAETKMLPLEQSSIAIGPDDAGFLYTLSNLATQGVDNEQRIGDKVMSTGLQLKYRIANNNANRDYYVRCVVFKSDFGELDDSADSFLVDTANVAKTLTANDVDDILLSLNRKQMKVLYDNVHIVSKTGATAGPNRFLKPVIKFFKLKENRVFLTDTNGESQNNNIRFLIFVRDSVSGTVAAGNDIDFSLFSRYYYKDF